jgi:hypothetical protein
MLLEGYLKIITLRGFFWDFYEHGIYSRGLKKLPTAVIKIFGILAQTQPA